MTKKIIIIGLAGIAILFGAFYIYRSIKIAQAKQAMAEDIAVFFNYAQEQLPVLTTELEQAEKESPKDEKKISNIKEKIKTYTIAEAIAKHDLKTLENATPEELQFKDGQIWVEADRFKDTLEGRLNSRILAGENALAFVLFHSILDKTQEDKNATIAMLKILFDKKLDPTNEAGECFWAKDKPTDTRLCDYVATFSLPEAAQIYSFPEAQRLLNDYIKSYKKD